MLCGRVLARCSAGICGFYPLCSTHLHRSLVWCSAAATVPCGSVEHGVAIRTFPVLAVDFCGDARLVLVGRRRVCGRAGWARGPPLAAVAAGDSPRAVRSLGQADRPVTRLELVPCAGQAARSREAHPGRSTTAPHFAPVDSHGAARAPPPIATVVSFRFRWLPTYLPTSVGHPVTAYGCQLTAAPTAVDRVRASHRRVCTD